MGEGAVRLVNSSIEILFYSEASPLYQAQPKEVWEENYGPVNILPAGDPF